MHFTADCDQVLIDAGELVLNPDFFVNKVASLSVRTVSLGDENSTLLSLVLGVDLVVSSQLVGPMGELALLLVGAETVLHELFAQLGLFFVGVHGRFLVTFR
jgi:hypothetical protein